MTQRNKFKAVAYSLLLIIAIILSAFIWQYNQAKGRDYQRLGDLKQIQQLLADYFYRYNTYQVAGCKPPAAVDACPGEGEQRSNFGNLADPLSDRGYEYRIIALGDDDFEIGFILETNVSGLLMGEHSYTKNGIKQ